VKSYRVILQIVFLLGLILAFVLVRNYEDSGIRTAFANTVDQAVHPIDRIKRLEPDTPKDMEDPPFSKESFPSEVKPISDVLAEGKEMAFEWAYNDPDWERDSYKTYWHSTVHGGRWSYVPQRVHFAMHRLFTTYVTASIYYDFIHDLGISEESEGFKDNADKPFEKIETVVMQADIKKVVTLRNQVAIVAKPKREGLQAVMIPVKGIKPGKPDEHLLFQLATPEGDEIDYSLISYADGK